MRRMKRTNSVVSQEENGVVLPPAGRVLGVDDTSSNELTRHLLSALLAYKAGDFSVRLPSDWTGVPGKLADAFNEIADSNQRLSRETARVSRAVGKEGKLKQRLSVPGAKGGWANNVEAVNTLIDDLVWPTTEVTRTISAVAKGDLSRKITVDVHGEILQLKEAINTMVEQLRSFASEVTRVAREVGTEGKLGGQAIVPGVAGTWKDLTDNVNSMASNLTGQV